MQVFFELFKDLIPSPKTYFINAFRVSSVCIGLGMVSTIQDRVYFFKEVNGNGIRAIKNAMNQQNRLGHKR
jgi:hypothetical protein